MIDDLPCPFHGQFRGSDMRPLAIMAAAFTEVDPEDIAGAECFLSPGEAMSENIEAMVEGMFEVDVDDNYLTNVEADWLTVQVYEITRMTRDSLWVNPLVFDQGDIMPPRNQRLSCG